MNPAIAYVGDYSFLLSDLDSNNKKRYVLAYQRGKVVLDKELTEQSYRDLDLLKRFLEKNIGDCALATSFKIVQSSVTTVSNFKIIGGSIEKPAVLVVKGYPLVLFSDIEYNQQDATGSLTDDDYTKTVVPVISVPVSDRIDTVYIDTYLAEVSCEIGSEYLDTSIEDVDLAIQSANRFRVVQDILVVENTTTIPTDGYDINNVYHRYLKLAQIQRHTGNANILTVDITDSRKVVSTLESISDGTGDINVKNATVQDDLIVHGTVTIIDETHTHSEKLVVTCDTAAVDAITVNKSNTGQAIVINKTDNGDALVINKSTGTGYAIVVNSGTVKLPYGANINEFSTDVTLAGSSDLAVPTEKAVKTYVDTSIGGVGGTTNRLAKFTGLHSVGDSNVSDDGSITSVNESYFTVTKDDALEVTATVNNTNNSSGKSSLIVDCNFGGDYKSLTLTQYNISTVENIFGVSAAGSTVISSNAKNTALYIEQKGAKPIYIGNDDEIRVVITDIGSVNIVYRLGVNMNATVHNFELTGDAVFYDEFFQAVFINDSIRASRVTIEGTPDFYKHILLTSGPLFEDSRFAFNLTDVVAQNFYVSRFDDNGLQLDSTINPTFFIERLTGFIGINTSTFRGDPLESSLTLHKDNAIRILGEQGVYNYGGTIFFGDSSNVYLKEYQDDYFEIMATQGYYFSGGFVGIGTYPDVSYKLLMNGNSKFFTNNKAIYTCDDVQDSVIVTQYLKDVFTESVDSSNVINYTGTPANTFLVSNAYIYSTGERIRLSSTNALPSPFLLNTNYYVIIYDATYIQFALSFEDAMNGFYITINNIGAGIHSIIKQQEYSKHFVIDESINIPSKRWSFGILNVSEYSSGSDFYIARYDDDGYEFDSVLSRTFLINRNNGFVGIAVREAQYQLDVNGQARFGNDYYGSEVYAASFLATGQYSVTNIGDFYRYFDYGYISELHASSIKVKTISEGSIDNALLIDLSTSDGQLITAGYYDANNNMKHLSLSTDPLLPITSRKWSWSIQGLSGSHNSGANLNLYSHNNSGTENDIVMSFRRSNGYVGIGVTNAAYPLDTTTGNFSTQVRTPLLYPTDAYPTIGQPYSYAFFNSSYINESTVSILRAKPLDLGGDGFLKVINELDKPYASFSTVTGQAGQSGVSVDAHVKHWCLVANPIGEFSTSDILWSVGVEGVMYRREFTVSGTSVSPTVGSIYTNNGSSWTVYYVSIAGGSGRIICFRSSGTYEPLSSGVLTKLSGVGDDAISFSSVTGYGSNEGSTFALWRHDDFGVEIDSPVLIDRATGYTYFSRAYFNDEIHTDKIRANASPSITFIDDIAMDTGKKCISDFTGDQKITTNYKFYERTRSEGLGHWLTLNRSAGDALILNQWQVTQDGIDWLGTLDFLRITYFGFTASINGIFTWNSSPTPPALGALYLRYLGSTWAFNPDAPLGVSIVVGTFNDTVLSKLGVVQTHYMGANSWLRMYVPGGFGAIANVSFCATYPLKFGEPYLP